MISCINCKINILCVGIEQHGEVTCPDCKTLQYAIPSQGSFSMNAVTIDHETKTVSINP